MSYQKIIEQYGYTVEEVRNYLHRLRESGETNMFGSGPYLSREFGFPPREVKPIVMGYMVDGLGELD